MEEESKKGTFIVKMVGFYLVILLSLVGCQKPGSLDRPHDPKDSQGPVASQELSKLTQSKLDNGMPFGEMTESDYNQLQAFAKEHGVRPQR